MEKTDYPESKEDLIRSKFHQMVIESELGPRIDFGDLKEQVADSNGTLCVLMHPFYEDVEGVPSQYKKEAPETFEKSLQAFNYEIESFLRESSIPTIILEQRDAMGATINRCVTDGVLPNRDLYLLPTMKNYGTPFLPNGFKGPLPHPAVIENHRLWAGKHGFDARYISPVLYAMDNKEAHRSWVVLRNLMIDHLGVKKVLLAGKYIDIQEDSIGRYLGRCLGEAFNYMDFLAHENSEQAEFEVALSDLSFPQKPEELVGVPLYRAGGYFDKDQHLSAR